MSTQKTRFEMIFEQGQRRYEKKTGQQLQVALIATFTTVADVRSYIEQENERFEAFRDRNGKIYRQLNTAFTPIERLSQVLGAASSAGFPPAGACLGAVAFMIKSAQGVSTHYDRILELFDILGVSRNSHASDGTEIA
jgi:hypothetical protein